MNPSPPLMIAAVLALLLVATSCLFWLGRRRERNRLRGLAAELDDAVRHSDFTARLDVRAGEPGYAELSGVINELLQALENRDKLSRQRERLFRDLADTMPEVILIHTQKILFANKEAGNLLGMPPESLVGRRVTDIVRPAYRSRAQDYIAEQMSGGRANIRYELQLIDGEERARWAEVTGQRMRFRGSAAVLSVARDITYRKSVEAALGRGRRQAQITLESLSEGIVTADAAGRIDYLNAAAEKLTGTSREEAIGKSFSDIVKLVEEDDYRDLGDPVSRCLLTRQRINMGRRALLVPLDGGNEISIDASASPMIGPNDEITGAVLIMRDVGELRGLAREMSYQASHDALTGLVNRREFERQLTAALESTKTENSQHVLCYMDLDRFKAVNDTCGHAAGDNMLREIATLLREKTRDSDVLARLGGDEFALLLLGCPLEKARQIADDICAAVRAYRFVWQDRIFDIGISIGLVEVGQSSGTMDDVLNAADSACYVAKQEGRGRVHIYSAMDEVAARQRGEIHWLRKLQTAIREESFELYVQPIISVAGRVPRGPAVEVLLRMVDKDEGAVLPNQFIRVAERYQLIGALDRWVLRTTLNAVAAGVIRLPDQRSVAINISGQTMAEESFLDFVIECLDHSQVDPAQLCFEVTERAVLGDLQGARRFIGVLHGMGCTFSLDDFGSDIGSLASLQDLRIDFLKLDGVCTRNLTTDSVNQEVVAAVARLSKAVGFKVVAEQVEDQPSFDSLRDLGVNFIQGYYLEAPQALGE